MTSRFEEPAIRERCARLGVPLIPKGLAGFVPGSIDTSAAIDASPVTETVDAILIDDDTLVHVAWKHTARAAEKKLLCFASPVVFEKAMNQYDKATTIYIDSTLNDGVKGEEWAKKLFEKGFKNLYLATGYSAESFPPMPWIKGIIGKDSPWSD